jgi:predicted phosphodiesterase
MSRKSYKKKERRETFFQKITNFALTIIIACAISSQVCTAANNNLRFAQVSDAHYSTFEENTSYKFLKKSPELLKDALFQINTSGPYDFVMFTGDMVNKPKVSELESFIEQANTLVYPWYAVAGNHDIAIDGQLTKKKFVEVLKTNNKNMKFDKTYYSFTPKKGFRVIGLDSIIDYKLTCNGEYSKEELAWLKEELDSHKQDVIIIATHVPIYEPFSSPNHKLNNEFEVKKLLSSYENPIIVLQGHYHATKARQEGNIVYVSTPSLVTYPNSFRVININSNKERTLVDIFLKETNLKDIQSRSKLRLLGADSLYGNETDRNTTFEIKKNKE